MSSLGFGLMRLPLTNEKDSKAIDFDRTTEMIDCFLKAGFSYFDTAYVYHSEKSEELFKKAVLERHPRNSFTIATKMPIWLVKENSDYQKFFNVQLERCGVDYFDYYLLHGLGDNRYEEVRKNGGFEFIRKMKAEGKIKNIGFSFHDKAEVLDKILAEEGDGIDFVQLQINYIDWDHNVIQSGKCYETAVKYNKKVVVMEPVKGGCLASPPEEVEKLFKSYNPNASASSWAIRFAASLPNVLVVLSGMSTLEQVKDNVSYMKPFKPLSAEEKELVLKAADIINKTIAVPCTACAYCVDGCPQKINIPQYFTVFNNLKRYGKIHSVESGYRNASDGKGKASECIACKQCEEHCPQHIAIVDQLKAVVSAFEKAS